MSLVNVNEVCTCSHDISTHFKDREREGEYPKDRAPKTYRGKCLGLNCNECKRFVQAVVK